MLNRAFNDTSPGNLIYANQVTAATANLNGFANDFAASFASLSNADLANRVLGNLGLLPNDALKTALTDYYAANGAANRGLVTLQLASLLTSLEGNATYGAAAAAWNDEVATGFTYSANTANTGSQTGTPSQTFTLTVGADVRTGGGGNDTFDGSLAGTAQTLGSADVLDGGAGIDTLFAVLPGSVTPASLKSIEIVNFTSTNTTTLGLANATGVTSVNSSSAAGGAVTISGIASSVAVGIADTAQNHTITYTGVAGTADAATLTLRAVTGGTVTATGIETLTLINDGSATTGVTLTADKATSLVIKGSGDINLTAAENTVATKVDASGSTGAISFSSNVSTSVTITGGAGNDAITMVGGTDTKVNVDGGAGNDTITFTANLANGDTVAGGEGTADTLVGSSANLTGLTLQTPVTITGFERVQVSDGLGAALTTANIQAGIERVNLAGATGGKQITFEAGSRTLALAVAAGGAISVSDTGTATNDTITLLNTSTNLNVYNTQAVTVAGFETVNLNTSTSATRILQQVDTIGITPDVGGSVTLNILGNNEFQSAVITATSATGGAKIDASGLTGAAFFKNVGATVGITAITGSANADTIVGSATATTIDGGAGNDNITGGAGNDSIVGGAGDDALNAAAGTDVVEGGDGNDTVTVNGGALSAGDKFSGGDGGTDTLVFAALAAADNDAGLLAGVTGFEVVEFRAADDRSLAMSNFLNNQGITRLDFDDLGGNKTVTLTNVAANTNDVRLLAGSKGDAISFDRLIDNATGDTLTISSRAVLSGGDAIVKFTALDEETINISGSASTNHVTFTGFVVEDLTTLNVTGAADVSLASINGAAKLATVNAATATGAVTVNASTSTVAMTATGGSGVFTFTGGALADSITGGAAADVLTGGSGADTITGGEAGDTYSGGLGKDSIVLTETVAAVDRVRFAEAGASNVDTVTGFSVAAGARDVVGVTKGDIDNGGTANTLSAANGDDVNAAVAADGATVQARASGGAGATAAADGVNLLFMASTTVTTFAEAIGTNGFTNGANNSTFGTLASGRTEGIAAVYYDLSTLQAVFGYIRNTAGADGDTIVLNSADTFVEIVRVGMAVASYTEANIKAGFEIFA